MPKDRLPGPGEYVALVAAGLDWLAGTLGVSGFLVSPQVHAGNPDLGAEPILHRFEREDRHFIERQYERLLSSKAMLLEEGPLPAGSIVGQRTFSRAYDGLEDGGEQRQLVFVLVPCLSRSRRVGYIQLQVSRLGDARERAEHHRSMIDSYPKDWIETYGLPDHVVIVSDHALVLDANGERWRVRSAESA